MKKGITSRILTVAVIFSLSAAMLGGCEMNLGGETTEEVIEVTTDNSVKYKGKTAEEIVDSLTLEMKAAQMVQPAVYKVSRRLMNENCYGSIISKTEPLEYKSWQHLVDSFQKEALESEAGIPYLYGQDNVHGANYTLNAVIFPHNIGLGAANDPELMYQVGLITADEAKMCHMLFNFAPCVAQSVDPRWGRTYECYSSDIEIIKSLSTEYARGLIDGGVVGCTKHFFGDGNVAYGTGEHSDVARLIDRGDSTLSEEEIKELLSVYQAHIDAGVQSIMVSYSSLNGVKMHENKKYISYLKNEMGFDGFVLSDWEAVQNISGENFDEQVVNAINSGIDMLMEVERYDLARIAIIEGVNSGLISEDRVNDAVTRIIRVKLNAGIFEDPMFKNMKTVESEPGSARYRDVARKLVEESQVLVKNEGDVLPLKEGSSVYIMGPAADNMSVQCGGWTLDWNSSPTSDIPGVTTIKEGFVKNAEDYKINVITDKKQAGDADVILLVVGEKSYAEWYGDTEDLALCGSHGLDGNREAIEEAKSYGKPVVACIVAGRHVIISDYEKDFDGIVMSYLPGSEGDGVANVLCGKVPFKGKLPSPWYSSLEQIGTDNCWHEKGYGLE